MTSSLWSCIMHKQNKHVLDSQSLIHKVKCIRKWHYYRDVCVGYVCAKYNVCSVVFDGYQSPSIKDSEYQKRAQKACADIQVIESSCKSVF